MDLAARLGALQERQFRLFFIGQSTSLLGDGMVAVALSFAILDLTGSVSDLGFVFAARSIPLIGFLLVGGVFADRLSRRAVMLGADVIRLGGQGLTAALLISGEARLWQLIVLASVNGGATAFFNPALTGLTPAIVSPGRLQQANVLRGISMAAGGIAGPAISGALVATIGSGYALAVDAATFGVSALFLARLELPPHQRLPAQSFIRDLLDGWHEVRSRTWLWLGVLAASVANMMSAPFFVLGAAISKTSLGGPGAWALILSAFSAGSFVGGLIALRIRPRRPFFASFLGYLPFGLPSALLALHAPAIGVAAAGCVAGAGLMIGNAIWETTLQQQIPAQSLSRVTAYDWFGSLAFQPIGYAIVGPIALTIGSRPTLWAAFAIITLVNGAALSTRSIRSVRARPPELEDVRAP
ncbi:MAG TPA: MFS transporter [Gaiellaceae bacterium]